MKYCADEELKKAKGEMPKKSFVELAIVRSFKNKFKDTIMQWRNFFGYIRYKYYIRNRKDD